MLCVFKVKDKNKKSPVGDVQGNVDDVSTRQSSTEGSERNKGNNTEDKTGDIILSKFSDSKQDIDEENNINLTNNEDINSKFDILLEKGIITQICK